VVLTSVNASPFGFGDTTKPPVNLPLRVFLLQRINTKLSQQDICGSHFRLNLEIIECKDFTYTRSRIPAHPSNIAESSFLSINFVKVSAHEHSWLAVWLRTMR
jgi:hypothetical protein